MYYNSTYRYVMYHVLVTIYLYFLQITIGNRRCGEHYSHKWVHMYLIEQYVS